jgi:dTDP-4-amino-4,6-dideoxygalactose transaminase
LQPAFSYLGHKAGQFPQSELASSQVLALPVFPELTEAQQESVVQAIAKFYLG